VRIASTTAMMEICIEVLQDTKSYTPWFNYTILGYISKIIKVSLVQRYLQNHVHWRIIHKSQIMESREVRINGWINKGTVLYIHDGVWLTHEKEWN
jgi:hypothetical protein